MNTVFKKITKIYGENTVFKDLSLEIEPNKITAILGKSGSGKTTLLNILSGSTDFEGQIENPPKNIAYIFQETRLVPSLTVHKNLDYVLKAQILNKEERKKKIQRFLELTEIEEVKNKYPLELSGGQAQRVAIARAFAYSSDFLLMDEPFKEMDIALKKRLLDVFLKLYENDKKTVVFVTHEIDEAILLADTIYILDPPTGISLKIDLATEKSKRDLTSDESVGARAKLLSKLLK